jgi:hypothetical protein
MVEFEQVDQVIKNSAKLGRYYPIISCLIQFYTLKFFDINQPNFKEFNSYVLHNIIKGALKFLEN